MKEEASVTPSWNCFVSQRELGGRGSLQGWEALLSLSIQLRHILLEEPVLTQHHKTQQIFKINSMW